MVLKLCSIAISTHYSLKDYIIHSLILVVEPLFKIEIWPPLTPKGLRHILDKHCKTTTFLSWKKKIRKKFFRVIFCFQNSTIQIYTTLLWKFLGKKFKNFDRMDWKIIMFGIIINFFLFLKPYPTKSNKFLFLLKWDFNTTHSYFYWHATQQIQGS